MKGYYKLRKQALSILNAQLPEELFYHDLQHTLSVMRVCNTYISREKIDSYSAKLLRIGALLHDIGFTKSNHNHEEVGAEMAHEMMTNLGFSKKDIKCVQGLIMATKIPQSPKNNLEEIICDCDLDYLGRSTFYDISNKLYKELKHNKIVNSKLEWDKIQVSFLEKHKYRTDFALKHLQPKKAMRINELKEKIKKQS